MPLVASPWVSRTTRRQAPVTLDLFTIAEGPSALLAALTLSSAAAHAATTTTLDFDPNDACGSVDCVNNLAISQSYGDSAEVDVIYDSDIDASGLNSMAYYNIGASDLVGVAWGNTTVFSGATEIFLSPTAGVGVRLLGFDMGAFTSDRTFPLAVRDGDGTALFQNTETKVESSTASSFAPATSAAWESATGIRIQWAPDVDVAIDNIEFETYALAGTPVIPLPAAGWLLLAGLGGLAFLRRRA